MQVDLACPVSPLLSLLLPHTCTCMMCSHLPFPSEAVDLALQGRPSWLAAAAAHLAADRPAAGRLGKLYALVLGTRAVTHLQRLASSTCHCSPCLCPHSLCTAHLAWRCVHRMLRVMQ